MVTTRQSTQQKTAASREKKPVKKLKNFQEWEMLPREMQRLVLTKLDGPYRLNARSCSTTMNDLINTIPNIIPTIEFYETFRNDRHAMFLRWEGDIVEMEDEISWNNRKECGKDDNVAIPTFVNLFSIPGSIAGRVGFDLIFQNYDGLRWMRNLITFANEKNIKIRTRSMRIVFAHRTPMFREFLELLDEHVLREMSLIIRFSNQVEVIRDTPQWRNCRTLIMDNIWLPRLIEDFQIEDFFHFEKLTTMHVLWTPEDIFRLIQNVRSTPSKVSNRFSICPGLAEQEVLDLFDFVPTVKPNQPEGGTTRCFTMQDPQLVLEVTIIIDSIRGQVFQR